MIGPSYTLRQLKQMVIAIRKSNSREERIKDIQERWEKRGERRAISAWMKYMAKALHDKFEEVAAPDIRWNELMIMTPYDSNFNRRKRTKVGRGVSVSKTLRDRYGRTLRIAIDEVLVTRTRQLIERYEATGDVIAAQELADALQMEAATYLTRIAESAVPDWFSAVDRYAAGKFESSLKNALGIDAQSILNQQVYDTIRNETITSNVGLIRKLADEHYLEVKGTILTDYQGLGFPGDAKSLAGRIQDITGVTKERASIIARDQTAKLNSQMAQARQEDAGVTHYIWRTAGDQRVVGNPAGLYPKVRNPQMHGNHYERNGQTFAWANPPEDGAPGEAILCRCTASPVFVTEQLNVQPVGTRVMVAAGVA